MAATAEDATLQSVLVGERQFPIGPVTTHQLYKAKNLVVGMVRNMQIKQAKREKAIAQQVAHEFRTPDDKRELIAERLGISVTDLDDATFQMQTVQLMQDRMRELEIESGNAVQDQAIGMLMDLIEGMSEDQITEVAVLLLDRYTHSRVTKDYVAQHFALDWFLEALAIFLETNNVVSITKNLQRLMSAASTQMQAAQASAKSA